MLIILLLLAHDGQHIAATERSDGAKVTIRIDGDRRVIEASGLPDHTHGPFPNRSNPNAIRPQAVRLTVPAVPEAALANTPLAFPNKFGVALNGVVFDPLAAEWWQRNPASGWTYEPLAPGSRFLGLDDSHAHVQPSGAYHYHGIPKGLVAALRERSPSGKRPPGEGLLHVGWAADGFPIYVGRGPSDPNDAGSPLIDLTSSYRVRSGTRPSGPGGRHDGTFVEDWEYVDGAGTLDENNGRYGVTPEFPGGIYYYVLTDTFPYVPRSFRGTPDDSFAAGRRGGRGFGSPSRRQSGPQGRLPFDPPSRGLPLSRPLRQ